MRETLCAPHGAAAQAQTSEHERGDVPVTIADVWSRLDFIAVGVIFLGLVLLVIGELFGRSFLDVVGILAIAGGWVVFVARRFPRRSHQRR
jgi:hypothetical protein